MLINSLYFGFLFPLIFILYWTIPASLKQVRNYLLLIVSYLVYMNWKPAFATVLLDVTLITYSGGGNFM